MPSMAQEQWSDPLENGQRPWTRYPPSTFSQWPSVAANDDDIITFGSLPHISSCASGGNRQTNQKWLAISPNTHPADASPLATSAITSTAASVPSSAPPQRDAWLIRIRPLADELLHGGVGDAPEGFGLRPPVHEVWRRARGRGRSRLAREPGETVTVLGTDQGHRPVLRSPRGGTCRTAWVALTGRSST